MPAIPVVKIKADSEFGYVEINASDFDPAIHERLDGDDTPIPGPFDDVGRAELIELATAEVVALVAAASDDQLRQGLEAGLRQRRAEAAKAAETAAVAPEPEFDPADTNEDGKLTKVEIIADLEAMNIEFDPRALKADLLELRNIGRMMREGALAHVQV